MGKEARDRDLDLTPEEKAKFQELVDLLARHGFGEQGPPRQTAFAEIEQFGHRAGRMVARAVDTLLAQQHARHFSGSEPCPSCSEHHELKPEPHELRIMTIDGEVPLPEPVGYCPPCRRDFFPSTHRVEA